MVSHRPRENTAAAQRAAFFFWPATDEAYKVQALRHVERSRPIVPALNLRPVASGWSFCFPSGFSLDGV